MSRLYRTTVTGFARQNSLGTHFFLYHLLVLLSPEVSSGDGLVAYLDPLFTRGRSIGVSPLNGIALQTTLCNRAVGWVESDETQHLKPVDVRTRNWMGEINGWDSLRFIPAYTTRPIPRQCARTSRTVSASR